MAFVGERHRLEGDLTGKHVKYSDKMRQIFFVARELQRALWTDPPKVRIMPGIPRYEIC